MIRRRPIMPPELRERITVAPGEVFFAAARTRSGWAVTTNRHLLLVPDAGATLVREWTDIESASSSPLAAADASSTPATAAATSTPATAAPGDTCLTIRWVDGTCTSLTILASRSPAFADTFREFVKRSIVHVEQVEGTDGAVRLVVRRASDDTLFAQVMSDGVDLTAPPVAKEVAAALARASDATGTRLQ